MTYSTISHGTDYIWFEDITANPSPAAGRCAVYNKGGDLTVYDDDDLVSAVKDVYGHMYADNVTQTTTVALVDTDYEITGGFTAGSALQGVTFGGSHYLAVDYDGTYLIQYVLSVYTSSAADEIESSIMIGGVAQANGGAHTTLPAANKPQHIGGNAIFSLSANDQISLSVLNHTAARDITMQHASVSIVRVGE